MKTVVHVLANLAIDLVMWPVLFAFLTGAMILALLEDRDLVRRRRVKITKLGEYPIARNRG